MFINYVQLFIMKKYFLIKIMLDLCTLWMLTIFFYLIPISSLETPKKQNKTAPSLRHSQIENTHMSI